MFPIYDLNGNIIGYNGRVYNGETENKYINPSSSMDDVPKDIKQSLILQNRKLNLQKLSEKNRIM